jgi:hypothetical protein
MKNVFLRLMPAILLAALPAVVSAETSLDSTTILAVQQTPQSGTTNHTVAPFTQFIGLDADNLGNGNLSAHLYGWGMADASQNSGTPNGSSDSLEARLTYGFLQYRFDQANARIRVGRFSVSEGILNEQVDGVSFRTDLPYGFGVSTFGGATVHNINMPGLQTDGKGDALFGGRLNYRLAGMLELGLSGVCESDAPTLPVDSSILPLPTAYGSYRRVGGDVYLSPLSMVQFSGHTSYNAVTDRIADNSYLLMVTPLKSLVLAATYDRVSDRNFFYSSILFSSMLTNLDQESRVIGGSATYTLNSKAEVSADYKDYKRDIGQAERFGGELRGNFADVSVRSGLSYHYLRASSDFAISNAPGASGSFQEVRGWVMRDSKTYFASLDVIDYIFKEPVENKNSAWEGSGSLGYHLTPAFAISGDLSYGQNPQYNDEVKGLIRLTYNMTTGKGETK